MYVDNIRQSSERMREMLNTLLDFFRLDNGKEQPRIRYSAQVPGEYRYYVTLLDKKRHRSYRYPEKGELSFTAVSYTHLDVYKRQGYHQSFLRQDLPCH